MEWVKPTTGHLLFNLIEEKTIISAMLLGLVF
jgi:hypothetical protein